MIKQMLIPDYRFTVHKSSKDFLIVLSVREFKTISYSVSIKIIKKLFYNDYFILNIKRQQFYTRARA